MRKLKKHIKIIISLVILLVSLLILMFSYYLYKLSPVSKNDDVVTVEIAKNATGKEIGAMLKENNLIRDVTIFRIYLKLHNINNLKSGIYNLSENMGTEKIIKMIGEGKGEQIGEISILFKEGLNIRKIAKIIADNTNNKESDVFSLLEDKTYIDSLIDKYWFLTNEIKDSSIYYPLEGYLAPDTYRFQNEDVTIKDIFEVMLDQMDRILKPYKDEIKEKNFSIHEFLSLASVVELEAVTDADRANVAGVFYNRLDIGMPLGSDVTTYYAVKQDNSKEYLTAKQINTYNPYNTRGPGMEGKLPIGPIASISKSSIKATAEPTDNEYLYFVSDKNKKLYFMKTLGDHERQIRELKEAGLWL